MRSPLVAKILYWLLMKTVANSEPTQIIRNGSETNLPYLRRWKIIDAQWWHPGIYLHNMILSDDAALHDHPYASLSIALTDGLTEYFVEDPGYLNHPAVDYSVDRWEWKTYITLKKWMPRREIRRGDIVFRSSHFAHRLQVDGEAWTLFIPFRRLSKGWGFWCPRGHKDFRDYHRDRRAAMAAGETGPLIGCGEE